MQYGLCEANQSYRDGLTKLPVHVTVGLAFAAAKWENAVIFMDIVERMAMECPSTLSGWEVGTNEKDRGIARSVGWECELLRVVRNFDLEMFLPSLYLRIMGKLTAVSVVRYRPTRAKISSGGITRSPVYG